MFLLLGHNGPLNQTSPGLTSYKEKFISSLLMRSLVDSEVLCCKHQKGVVSTWQWQTPAYQLPSPKIGWMHYYWSSDFSQYHYWSFDTSQYHYCCPSHTLLHKALTLYGCNIIGPLTLVSTSFALLIPIYTKPLSISSSVH